MNMYRYSKNVYINHPNIYKINITCGNNNDKRYIRYDVDNIKTDGPTH